MKKLAKKLTLLTLILVPLMFAVPLHAASPGNDNAAPDIELTGQQVVSPGNTLVMNLDMPAKGQSEITVTNLAGDLVWKTELLLEAGENKVKFKVGALADGVYFLRVAAGGKSDAQTFAVQ